MVVLPGCLINHRRFYSSTLFPIDRSVTEITIGMCRAAGAGWGSTPSFSLIHFHNSENSHQPSGLAQYPRIYILPHISMNHRALSTEQPGGDGAVSFDVYNIQEFV